MPHIFQVTEAKDEDISPGIIEYDTGEVRFRAKYSAILFRPFKNEVLDTKVTNVHEVCVGSKPGLVIVPD